MSQENANPGEVAGRARRRQGTLTGLLMTLGSSYVALLLGILQGVLVMRAIGPTGQGLRRLVDLFNKWLSNTHLGALHGLSKQLPMILGRGQEERAQELEDVGAWTVLALGLAGSLVMLAYALFWPGNHLLTREILAIGAAIIWTGQAYSVYSVVLRAWGTYSVLAVASLVTSVAGFVLIVGGAYLFGVMGATLGWLGANLVQLLYLARASRLKVRLRWNWRLSWWMIRVGWPLWATVFADTLLRTVDGIVVVRYTDAYVFGLYALAMQLAAYLYYLPGGLGFVIMPRIWEKYGEANGHEGVRRQVLVPTLATATVMPVVSGLAFILTPYMVRFVVPRFAPGAFAAQIMALGATLLALPMAANGLLVAMNRELTVTFIKLAGSAVAGAGAWWAITHTGSLAQVAAFTCLGYMMSSLLALGIVLSHYYPARAALGQLAICHLPLAYALGAIYGAGRLTATLLGTTEPSWTGAALRVLLFLLLCAPLLWYGNRRTGILRQLRHLIASRLARSDMPLSDSEP